MHPLLLLLLLVAALWILVAFVARKNIPRNVRHINIAEDFSRYPLGRRRKDSSSSGEAFRDDILVPALRESDLVVVYMDGTAGYGSSFLEETFGGLKRLNLFTPEELQKKLSVVSTDASILLEIDQYMNPAR